MNKEFIPYEQALELKELGFDEPCLAFYNGKFLESTDYDFDNGTSKDIGLCIVAPLYQQSFRWFRENQGYHIDLFVDDDKTFGFCITYFTYTARVDKPIQRQFNTYEEAELACLKKLIEIAKQ
jgi:hypothetical protein